MRYGVTMRTLLAVAFLALACGASAPSTPTSQTDASVTDALQPVDDVVAPRCLMESVTLCDGSSTAPPPERLYRAAGVWNCLSSFDIPETQREALRLCICRTALSVMPSEIEESGHRHVRAACCGRSTLGAVWCSDAGM